MNTLHSQLLEVGQFVKNSYMHVEDCMFYRLGIDLSTVNGARGERLFRNDWRDHHTPSPADLGKNKDMTVMCLELESPAELLKLLQNTRAERRESSLL